MRRAVRYLWRPAHAAGFCKHARAVPTHSSIQDLACVRRLQPNLMRSFANSNPSSMFSVAAIFSSKNKMDDKAVEGGNQYLGVIRRFDWHRHSTRLLCSSKLRNIFSRHLTDKTKTRTNHVFKWLALIFQTLPAPFTLPAAKPNGKHKKAQSSPSSAKSTTTAKTWSASPQQQAQKTAKFVDSYTIWDVAIVNRPRRYIEHSLPPKFNDTLCHVQSR